MAELQEVGNAGLVRPTNGLAFGPEWVDCPNCRKRQKTQVSKMPSEHSKYVPRSGLRLVSQICSSLADLAVKELEDSRIRAWHAFLLLLYLEDS